MYKQKDDIEIKPNKLNKNTLKSSSLKPQIHEKSKPQREIIHYQVLKQMVNCISQEYQDVIPRMPPGNANDCTLFKVYFSIVMPRYYYLLFENISPIN